MAFRASTMAAAVAFERIRQQAVQTKAFLQTSRASLVQASVPAGQVLSLAVHFGNVIPSLDTLATTPGLAQYARDQFNDQNYDVVAEFNAMRTAMANLLDGVVSQFPRDANGWILYQQLTPAGGITIRSFTAAQVANLVTLLDAVVASIE